MPTRKRTRPTTFAILLMVAMSATGVAALGYYVSQNSRTVPQDERRIEESDPHAGKKPEVKVDVQSDVETPKQIMAEVLTPEYKDMDLTFKREKVEVPAGEDPKVFAINAYLAKAGVTAPAAKALSVDVKGGVATIGFTEAIVGEGYGSDDERTLVNGIAAVMGQFKDVEKVLMTVGGKPIELGHLDVSEPIKVKR